MKVLVMEDDDRKYAALHGEIERWRSDGVLRMDRADNLAVAMKLLYEEQYDLIIVDLMMPQRVGELAVDVSEDVIVTIGQSSKNVAATIVALSGFDDVVDAQRKAFSDVGITVVNYSTKDDAWKRVLILVLERLRNRVEFEFVIIVALEKEREAYRSTRATIGKYRNIRGLDCLELTVDGMRGVCIKLPRMGLVNASIITTRAVECFAPKVVAMSGICAGVKEESSIGDLVVADPCWEHQAGKWSSAGFKTEPYHVEIDQNTTTMIDQSIAMDPTASRIKGGLSEREISAGRLFRAPMVSGSAVIADEEKMVSISGQHRKLAALDMEMYGVYEAGKLCLGTHVVFGAKVVVDVGDGEKSDRLHVSGCVLAARYVLDTAISVLVAN